MAKYKTVSHYKKEAYVLASAAGITINTGGGRHFEVMLDAPEGYRFGSGVHQLVTAGWDRMTPIDVWQAVVDDLKEHASTLEHCPSDCDCGEGSK